MKQLILPNQISHVVILSDCHRVTDRFDWLSGGATAPWPAERAGSGADVSRWTCATGGAFGEKRGGGWRMDPNIRGIYAMIWFSHPKFGWFTITHWFNPTSTNLELVEGNNYPWNADIPGYKDMHQGFLVVRSIFAVNQCFATRASQNLAGTILFTWSLLDLAGIAGRSSPVIFPNMSCMVWINHG